MKIFFSLFSLICCANLFAQETVKFVFDKSTNRPVPFATIKVLHAPKGCIANDAGQFKLNIERADSLLFSSVGYENLIITGNQIGDTVFLTPSTKSLDPITISTKKIVRNFLVGNGAEYINKKLKCSCGPGLHCKSSIKADCLVWGPGGGTEFAEAIATPDSSKSYQLGKVWLPLGQFSCWQPMYLHLYAIDSLTKKPGELLFTKYVTKTSGIFKNGKLTIDLTSDNLVIENTTTFFISLQWDTDFSNKDCVTTLMLVKTEKANTYSRSILYANYQWLGVFGQSQDDTGNYHTVFAVELNELKTKIL